MRFVPLLLLMLAACGGVPETLSSRAGGLDCWARLQALGVVATPVPRLGEGRCGLIDGVRVQSFGAVSLDPPAAMTCPLALQTAQWLDEVVQPASQAMLGARVAKVGHWGTYRCRAMGGSWRASEHAYANALDVSQVTVTDGRTLTVRRDWALPFWKRVAMGACALFSVVLSPDHDRAHADHLHLDLGDGLHCGVDLTRPRG